MCHGTGNSALTPSGRNTGILTAVLFVHCPRNRYADVLTHVNVDGFDCRQVLEDLVSADRLGGLRQEFNQLLALLQRQRRQHRAEVGWRPSDVDVQLLMREHADIILVRHLKELSIKVLAGLAVAGVAYYAISRRIWARRP